jgi:hypothetical protein
MCNDPSLYKVQNDPATVSHIVSSAKAFRQHFVNNANMILSFAQHYTSPWKFVPPKGCWALMQLQLTPMCEGFSSRNCQDDDQ